MRQQLHEPIQQWKSFRGIIAVSIGVLNVDGTGKGDRLLFRPPLHGYNCRFGASKGCSGEFLVVE